MADTIFWVFYDVAAKIQSNFMPTVDAQTSILKMRPQEVSRFLIWTNGWENWQPLKTYLESDQNNFVSTFTVSSSSPHSNENTVKATMKEVIENTLTNTRSDTKEKSAKEKKEDTKSYSSIHLKEETISRIVKEEKLNQFNVE